jgi:hypothetical protein
MRVQVPIRFGCNSDTAGRGLPLAQSPRVGKTLVSRCNGAVLRLICFLIGAALMIGIGGCRRGVPVLDTSPKPTQVDGTISGVVRGPEGTSPIEGRQVAVINVDTGERQTATTNSAGGFSFKIKPGKYRVELALLQGESIVKKPGVINVNKSDVDAHADFVIGSGSTRTSRPRFGPRRDDGLGSPIA